MPPATPSSYSCARAFWETTSISSQPRVPRWWARTCRSAFDKETVLAAPKVKVDEHLTEGEEHRLYDHYGLSKPEGGVSITRVVVIDLQ